MSLRDDMGVIALMRCGGINTFVAHFKGKEVIGGVIDLSTVYSDDESLREYADATPSGKLELNIQNPEALKQFTPGKYYTIKIEEIDRNAV